MHPVVKIPPDCPAGFATGVLWILSPGGARRIMAPLAALEGMPGAGLTFRRSGQAGSARLILKPYWGKPAVRNLRGGSGTVGIIRRPVRATALPD